MKPSHKNWAMKIPREGRRETFLLAPQIRRLQPLVLATFICTFVAPVMTYEAGCRPDFTKFISASCEIGVCAQHDERLCE